MYVQAENLGFVRGTNLLAAHARFDILVLQNPDTLLLDDSLQGLCAYVAASPGVGAVGPRLLNEDGSDQVAHYRFPRIPAVVREHLVLTCWQSACIRDHAVVTAGMRGYQRRLSCAAGRTPGRGRLRRTICHVFGRGGSLPPPHKQGAAECLLSGWVLHYGEKSARREDANAYSVWHYHRSRLLYFAIHESAVQQALVWSVLVLSLVGKAVILAIVGKRASAGAHASTLMKILRFGRGPIGVSTGSGAYPRGAADDSAAADSADIHRVPPVPDGIGDAAWRLRGAVRRGGGESWIVTSEGQAASEGVFPVVSRWSVRSTAGLIRLARSLGAQGVLLHYPSPYFGRRLSISLIPLGIRLAGIRVGVFAHEVVSYTLPGKVRLWTLLAGAHVVLTSDGVNLAALRTWPLLSRKVEQVRLGTTLEVSAVQAPPPGRQGGARSPLFFGLVQMGKGLEQLITALRIVRRSERVGSSISPAGLHPCQSGRSLIWSPAFALLRRLSIGDFSSRRNSPLFLQRRTWSCFRIPGV